MTGSLVGRRIAIIGGGGFIGHHLALDLVRRGATVEVIDSLQVNNMLAVHSEPAFDAHRPLYLRMLDERLALLREAGVPLLVQDARDYHALGRVLAAFEPHVIFHAAAVSHAGKSNKDPFSTFDHSLRTLENALDCARSLAVERFIFFSSSMAYGNFRTPEVSEDHPLDPIGIYGALKAAGEKIVVAYQQVFGLDYTIVRPSALYGARCISRRVGQVFIENALVGEPLQIAGDGEESIDFTYVDDLVDGLRLVIERPEAVNQIFNLTTGNARRVLEVAEIVREAFPGTEIEHVQRDVLMPFRGTLSVDKARSLLGYEPRNQIETGFLKYIDWYRGFAGSPVAV